jgi:LPXTG-motif cell wall-anchored protein
MTLTGDQFLNLIYLVLVLVLVAGGVWWRKRR